MLWRVSLYIAGATYSHQVFETPVLQVRPKILKLESNLFTSPLKINIFLKLPSWWEWNAVRPPNYQRVILNNNKASPDLSCWKDSTPFHSPELLNILVNLPIISLLTYLIQSWEFKNTHRSIYLIFCYSPLFWLYFLRLVDTRKHVLRGDPEF